MTATSRLQSLDVFRGIIICLMILVGASGNYDYTYKMLDHAPWTGITPTDFIFPSFLFIVGVAQSLSLKRLNIASRNRKILKRFLILFLLGILINSFPFFYIDSLHEFHIITFSKIRVMGVLQRIAIAYAVCGILEYVLSLRALAVLCPVILLLYFVLLYNTGYTVPENPVRKIDLFVLGATHMYTEKGVPFDPEGLLSTLPALVNVLGGYLTGRWLRLSEGPVVSERLLNLLISGSLITVSGYLLSFGDPVIKKLWTASFTLITTGAAMMLFAAVVYGVDMKKCWRSTPRKIFTQFGKNAILIYLVSELMMRLLVMPLLGSDSSIYSRLYEGIYRYAGLYNGALLQACTYLFFCWLIVFFLDKKQIYLKV